MVPAMRRAVRNRGVEPRCPREVVGRDLGDAEIDAQGLAARGLLVELRLAIGWRGGAGCAVSAAAAPDGSEVLLGSSSSWPIMLK